MQTDSAKNFEWNDKTVSEVLFDSLMWVGVSGFAAYGALKSFPKQENNAAEIQVLFIQGIVVGLFLLTVWHFTSRKKIKANESGLIVTRYLFAFIPVSKRLFPKGSVTGVHIHESRGGAFGGPSYWLMFKLADGTTITVCKSSNRADLHKIEVRM